MLRKLSPTCEACHFKDACDHKEMVGYGVIEHTISTASQSLAQPCIRETTTIMVHGTPLVIYKDNLENEINKAFHLGLNFGA